MTKMTKNILMVGGVAIVGYLLYKKYGNKSTMPTTKASGTSSFDGGYNFMNASGTRRTRSGETIPDCPACSKDGRCMTTVPRTDGTIAAGIAGQRAETECVAPTTSSSRRRFLFLNFKKK
jgi:hypothetical protein